MMKLFKLFILLSFISCEIEPQETTSGLGALMQPGDIVVSSNSADSAILLDEDGNFKSILYNPPNNIDQVYGLAWNDLTREVIVSINGLPDRIVAISAIDGSVRTITQGGGLNGNTFGVAVDADGYYYAVETSAIEKFSPSGARETSGFPVAGVMSNMTQISYMSTGEFLICSSGTDRARIYNSSMTQQHDTNSGIGGTTNSYGCKEMPNGNIAVSWDGSADAVIIYDDALNATGDSFSDTTRLTSPRGIGVRENGNILVADAYYDWIVEFDSSANFIRTIGGGILSDPWQVLVIPNF